MDTSTLNPNAANIVNLAKTTSSDKAATDTDLQNADSADISRSFTNSNFKDLNSLSKQAIYSANGLNKIQEGGRGIGHNDRPDGNPPAAGGDLLPRVLDQSNGEPTEKGTSSTTSDLNGHRESNKEPEVQAGSADKAGDGHPEFIKKLLLVPWISKLVDLSNKLIGDHFPNGVLQKFKSAKDDQVPDVIDLSSAESTDIEVDSSMSDPNNGSESENEPNARAVEPNQLEMTSPSYDSNSGLDIIDAGSGGLSLEVESAKNDRSDDGTDLTNADSSAIDETYSTQNPNIASGSEKETSIREVLSDTAQITPLPDKAYAGSLNLEVVDDDSTDASQEVEDAFDNQVSDGIDLSNGDSTEREVGFQAQDLSGIYESEYDSNIYEPEYDSIIQENELNRTEMPLPSDYSPAGSSALELIGDTAIGGVSQVVEDINSERIANGLGESNRDGNELAEDSSIPHFYHNNGLENESNIQESNWDRPGPIAQHDSSNSDPMLLPVGLGLLSGGIAQGGGGSFARGIIDLEATKGPSKGAKLDKNRKSDKKVAKGNQIPDENESSEEQSTERETDFSTANLNSGNGAKVESNIPDDASNQDETAVPKDPSEDGTQDRRSDNGSPSSESVNPGLDKLKALLEKVPKIFS